MFDGTASYWAGNNLSSLGYSSMTIELTLHKTFAHGTKFYIDFGNVGWRAKTVKVEVINTNYANDVWTTKINKTGNGSGHVNGDVGHTPVGASNGSGFNKIRITLSDWNTLTDCRIAEIGILNYASGGLSETYLSRGGGSVYGNILPFKDLAYNLGSATNRWANIYGNATSATTASKVAKSFILSDGSGTVKFDGSADITLTVPADMIHSATNSGFSLKRESKTFCAIVNTVVNATPFWKIKLTSYSDNFNGHAPQNGDTLFLWVKNTIASSSTAYPFCIPYSSAGESDNSKCIPLYHGQNTGTPKEWLGSTALSAGFYMFVFRSDVRGTSTAITTNGGWVFLYRNVSTT